MNEKAKYYIEKLQLTKHPEGGYFKEIYRAGEMFYLDEPKKSIKRNVSTSIYFLLEGYDISCFHRLKSDEIWHYYDGNTVCLYIITTDGKLEKILLGRAIEKGEQFQKVINKNSWFAAEVINKKGFALIGCTVSPGFDFNDFELADCKLLEAAFPEHEKLIRRFSPFKED